jgi:hypothetical protein
MKLKNEILQADAHFAEATPPTYGDSKWDAAMSILRAVIRANLNSMDVERIEVREADVCEPAAIIVVQKIGFDIPGTKMHCFGAEVEHFLNPAEPLGPQIEAVKAAMSKVGNWVWAQDRIVENEESDRLAAQIIAAHTNNENK